MTCSQCEDLFAAHLEGLLDATSERQLEAHLAECPACRTAVDETRGLFRRLEEQGSAVVVSSITPVVMDQILLQQAIRFPRRNGIMRRVVKISVAAALLIGLGIVLSQALLTPTGGRVYAAELSAARKQAAGATTATWRISYYRRFLRTGSTESRWFRCKNDEQRCYYKAPGLYRTEQLDENGDVGYVSIEDVASRAQLDINQKARTATLRYVVESLEHPRGPFAKYLEPMQRDDLESLGKQDVAGRPAHGFRYEFDDGPLREYRTLDFWVDAQTKRLVLCQDPGRNLFDATQVVPDTAWDSTTGDTIEYGGAVFRLARGEGEINSGHIVHDIVFDGSQDDSLFALEPPEGYAFKTVPQPAIAEKDVLEFMGIVAEYFHGTFPDRMPQFVHSSKEELERYGRALQAVRQRSGASPAEVKLVEAIERWYQTGIPGPGPMGVFITQRISRGSWKYLGKGVRLGDKDRIVCWYQPKGARTYRVVYGDLSVKDVAPEDLPMPVGR
jgi:Putative zinc-finger